MKQLIEISEIQNKFKAQYPDTRLFLNNKSLRLTPAGIKKLSKDQECWLFEHNGVNAGQLIKLFRNITSPYGVTKKQLVIFSEQDAFMIKMASADIWLSEHLK